MNAIDKSKWTRRSEWDFRGIKPGDINSAIIWEYVRASESLLETASRCNREWLRDGDLSSPWLKLKKKPIISYKFGSPITIHEVGEIEPNPFSHHIVEIDFSANAGPIIDRFRKWLVTQKADRRGKKVSDDAAKLKWLAAWKLDCVGKDQPWAKQRIELMLKRAPHTEETRFLPWYQSRGGWSDAISGAKSVFAEIITISAKW